MKQYQRWFATLLVGVFMITGFSTCKSTAQGTGDVSYQEFYDELSPYGEWINDDQYGYVWVPDVEEGFQPYYSGGRWAMTEYGNTWVSDYSWGWAPFHYGRWTYDEYYGWIWLPDTQWGPAWVSWRSGGGYYGWAPLGPGVNVSVSFGGYNAPYDWWVFIPCNRIYSNSYYSYYRGPQYNQHYIQHTSYINYTHNYNHATYAIGPRATEIQAYTKQRVNIYGVRNQPRASATVIANNSVNIYRPRVNKTKGDVRPVPGNVIRPDHRIGRPQPVSVNNGRPRGIEELRAQRQTRQQDRTNPANQNTPDRNPNVRPQNPVRNDRANNNDRPQPVQQSPRVQPQREPRQGRQQQNNPRTDRPQPVQQAPRVQPQREPRPVPVQQDNRRFDRPQPAQQQPRVQPQREPRQAPVQQQRVDRPQPQREQPQQRVDRPQPQREQPQQRVDRPQPQQQRVDRPQPQQDRPQQREHGRR